MNKRFQVHGYKEWRDAVFKRDGGKCQSCGAEAVHTHHIKGWYASPELRVDVSNGICLCLDCHEKTPGYMRKDRSLKLGGRTKTGRATSWRKDWHLICEEFNKTNQPV